MAAGTVLRFGEIWAAMNDIARARPAALWGYVAAGVLIPWLFFFIFPQSNMRGFGALLLNDFNYTSAETGRTAASMFPIAFVLMGAFVFAGWSALLTETRDEISGEIMSGFANSLLSSLVIFVVVLALIIVPSSLLGASLVANSSLGPSPSPPAATMLITPLPLAILIPAMLLLARLCLAGPVMAAEGSINPFFGLARSWRLTRGHFGKILLIVAPLYILAVITISLFLSIAAAVLIATDGTSWHDNALSAGWLAIQTLLVLGVILIPAGLYRAIRPAVDTEVFAQRFAPR